MIQLYKLGIDTLNAMQQDTAQAYRKSKSLVLLSPTGSGKTLAYLIPMLETINVRNDQAQAMVIVPSRELALQTQQVIKQSGTDVRSTAVYGGRPAMDEHRTLKGLRPHVIIGTPGRLLDHLTKGNIEASDIHTLIIDEFDKCLEMGFREEVMRVFQFLTNVERRMLLSATDNPEITKFLPEYTRLDYLEEEVGGDRIEHYTIKSPEKDKLETLRRLLLSLGSGRSLVFVGYRESVERVAIYLKKEGFYISALHGGMEQRERERSLYRFSGGSTNVMVSTDLASRGLDIPEVDNVIHYHLPLNHEAYIHRNGRTARWDKEGKVFVIVGPEESFEGEGALEPFSDFKDTQEIPVPLWDSIYIGKGKKDKLSKSDVAGFLMKVGGLKKEEVGRIDVREHYSYAAVARNKASETLRRLYGQKIKGMKTLFERTK